jgi:phosphoribosylformylglycinamidine synthase
LVEGVVQGISSYGNSIGVPTVGGEMLFDECYAENPLVNVACLGVVEDRLMHGRAEGPGNRVVLIGNSTGRDGIGGASVLASAEFDDSSHSKRPAVQVGDPFVEKLLIEACLELVSRGCLVALQDLGAGGISCPASEMPSKAGTGMRLDIGAVPRREAGMEPFEVMISESQERMLAVVEATRVDEVLQVCEKWGLPAAVLGEVTGDGKLSAVQGDDVVAEVPARALAEEAPVYERSRSAPPWLAGLRSASCGDGAPEDLGAALEAVLGAPSVASKRWAWEQYDHMIFLGTLVGPGGDAAVIRLPDRRHAVALSVDCNSRFCYLDPYEGARLAVAEAARNVAVTGATPLAVTNCLNFGNPEKPEVMWQFAEAVRGMGDACRTLELPVTGGNVSFYNETNGRPIHPTPVVAVLGSLPDPGLAIGAGFVADGEILLLGRTNPGDFGGSEYAKAVHGALGGRPPRLDMKLEAALHELLFEAARLRLLSSAHDLSDGGLAVALAEAALLGGRGFTVTLPAGEPHRILFSESPSRALVTCSSDDTGRVEELGGRFGVPVAHLGVTGGATADFGVLSVPLEKLANVYESAVPRALSHLA